MLQGAQDATQRLAVFQEATPKEGALPSHPGEDEQLQKGLFFAFAEDNPCRNKDGSRDRYLPIISGDEGEEFIHVAHTQPL